MIVGTAGHIDHGKTALVRALTGVDTDRLKEEKARGISIDLGFAFLPAPGGGSIGFIDVPGHERFVRTMIAGASGIDFALLAVAADDGCKPQTFEHLAILGLLGVRRGLVALTKADLVGPERLPKPRRRSAPPWPAALCRTPRSRLCRSSPERDWRPCAGGCSPPPRKRRAAGRAALPARRRPLLHLAGAGVVVTGTVLSGSVRVGDRILVSPSGLEARVRGLHAQNHAADEARAGQRCALNLAGDSVTKEAIRRGDVALDAALHAPTDRIDAVLDWQGGDAGLRQWFPVRLHHASAEVGARIVLFDDGPLRAGGSTLVQLVLDRPIAAAVGDRFVARDVSGQHTLGGGRFLDLRAPSRRRRTPERRRQLLALALTDPADSLRALLTAAPYVCDWRAFWRDNALSEAQARSLAVELDLVIVDAADQAAAVLPDRWQAFRDGLLQALAAYHDDHPDLQGIGRERLRLALEPRFAAPVFVAALQRLAREGSVALDGAFVRLPSHAVRLTEATRRSGRRLRPSWTGGAVSPPARARPWRAPGGSRGRGAAAVQALCAARTRR